MIRVMIADDQVFIRKLLSHIVSSSGGMHVVGEACTGLDLLEKLPGTDADVIVMDLMMPGLAWSETLGRIRHHYPDLPVVVVSSLPSMVYGDSVRAAGATDYIDKMRVAEVLATRVRAVVKRPYRAEHEDGSPIAEPSPSTVLN